MSNGAPEWVKWSPQRYLDGVVGLTDVEELVYFRTINLIYVSNDRLPDDDRRMAQLTKTGRRYRAAKENLLKLGKLIVVDGFIRNPKATDVLCTLHGTTSARSRAGIVSGKVRSKSNKINGHRSTQTQHERITEGNRPPDTSAVEIEEKEEKRESLSPVGVSDSARAREERNPNADLLCVSGESITTRQLIDCFDEIRATVWDVTAVRRTTRGDHAVAGEWLKRAPRQPIATFAAIFQTEMKRIKEKGSRAPITLAYIDDAVRQALAKQRQQFEADEREREDPIVGDVRRGSWVVRMKLWLRSGIWQNEWGPDPNNRHCNCPPDVVPVAKRQLEIEDAPGGPGPNFDVRPWREICQ